MYRTFLITAYDGVIMARLRKIAEEILKRYPDRFTEDFEHNKIALEEIADAESKYLRNALAGYITRYISRTKAVAEEAEGEEAGAAAA